LVYIWHRLFMRCELALDDLGGVHCAARFMLASRRGSQQAPAIVSKHLRHPSDRPALVLDPAAFGVVDPASGALVGRPGPFGRERVLSALPLDPGPALLSPPAVVRDPGAAYLADPNGSLIGDESVWVNRMLTVRFTEDTRRLGW
jgi:hypothetical protein